eukprot:2249130-Pleurochrysis_carterae.AAC.1
MGLGSGGGTHLEIAGGMRVRSLRQSTKLADGIAEMSEDSKVGEESEARTSKTSHPNQSSSSNCVSVSTVSQRLRQGCASLVSLSKLWHNGQTEQTAASSSEASLGDELAQCDCLVVLLTRRVLAEPNVLLAVWHAVQLNVPVFTVKLTNGGYDFDQARKALRSLRSSLSLNAVAMIEQQLPAGTTLADFQQ